MKKLTILCCFVGTFATFLAANPVSLATDNAQPTESADAAQLTSEQKFPEFYNDERYAIYRDPRYAKPLPDGMFGMRTIKVPEAGFHNDEDRELYMGLKGVADVLAQANNYNDGLLQKLEPYSKAIFGKETTDYYEPVVPRFVAVVYQAPEFLMRTSIKPSSAVVIVSHVDGYILFHYNKKPRGYVKSEQIEENGNWQTGEIFAIDVFYFDRRDAIQATFFSDGLPETFRRSEFTQAPSFLCVPNRPSKKKPTDAERVCLFNSVFEKEFRTRPLTLTRWDKNGSVVERVAEPQTIR